MVRLENIAIGYEDDYEILSDLNFQLSKGSFHFLVGASGSGKSTLLKFLYMALQQARGQYFLSGNNVENLDVTQDLRNTICNESSIVHGISENNQVSVRP